MLTMRKEQMEVFSRYMLARFENAVVADLKRTFPEKCQEQGDEGVRAAIREGIERAAGHGVTIGYDVERFIFLMYFLGPGFDSSPRVAQILRNPAFDSRGKMDRVCSLGEQELHVPTDKWPRAK